MKLVKLLNEIRINKNRLNMYKRDEEGDPYYNDKVYRVKMEGNEEFTLHKHKNHYNLYPSFYEDSEKYARIKQFLTKRGVKFTEVRKTPGKININISIDKLHPLDEIQIKSPEVWRKFKKGNKVSFIRNGKTIKGVIISIQPFSYTDEGEPRLIQITIQSKGDKTHRLYFTTKDDIQIPMTRLAAKDSETLKLI